MRISTQLFSALWLLTPCTAALADNPPVEASPGPPSTAEPSDENASNLVLNGDFENTTYATVSAAYLSVEQVNTGDIWNHIDNFSLQLFDSTPTNASTWGQIKNKCR